MRTILFILLLAVNYSKASDLFWVNGSGNWSQTNHWSLVSGGTSCNCTPTPTDNVIFDSNSLVTGATVNLDVPGYCNNLTIGGNSFDLTGNAIHIYASLDIAIPLTGSYSGQLFFESSSIGNTITTSGNIINSNFIFNNSLGEWSLSDDLNTTSVLDLRAGTFRTNNHDVQIKQFNSTGNSNNRNLYLGSSLVQFVGSVSNGTFNVSGTGFFMDAGTSLLVLNDIDSKMSLNKNLAFYDIEFANPNSDASLSIYGPAAADTIFFHKLTLKGNTIVGPTLLGNDVHLIGGRRFKFFNLIVSGTIDNIATCTDRMEFYGNIYKASGAVVFNYTLFHVSNVSGGSSFTAYNSSVFHVANGWSIIQPLTSIYYWIGGKGSWNDASHWSFTSGGVSAGCVPSYYDDVIFDMNSFQATGDTVFVPTVEGHLFDPICRNMTWQQVNFSPVLYDAPIIGRSLVLHATMQPAFNNGQSRLSINFISDTIGNTVYSAGRQLSGISFGGDGSWMILDSLNARILTHIGGELNTNSQYLNLGGFESDSNDSTYKLILGSSVIDITGGSTSGSLGNFDIDSPTLDFDPGTSTIRFLGTNNYMRNGNKNLYNVEFNNAVSGGSIISDPNVITTLHNLTMKGFGLIGGSHQIDNIDLSAGRSYRFAYNDTQTIISSIIASGSLMNPITLYCTNGTSYIQKLTGAVCIDYANITNLNAIGSAVFYAGANSIDGGNTTGWIFQPCVSTGIDDISSNNCCILNSNLIDDQILLQFYDDSKYTVQLYTMSGQSIFQSLNNADEMRIPLSGMASGFYILSVQQAGKQVYRQKVMKL